MLSYSSLAVALFTLAMLACTPATSASVLISNADKLNGYITAKHFLDRQPRLHAQHAAEGAYYAPTAAPWRVHCTVEDVTSTYAAAVRDLGCTTIPKGAAEADPRAAWDGVFSAVPDLELVVLVPDMHQCIPDEIRAGFADLGARAPHLKHVVFWSRVGAGSSALPSFQLYRQAEEALRTALSSSPVSLTILRLAFGLERFLDLAVDLQEQHALRLPLSGQGTFAPISLHDAAESTMSIFRKALAGSDLAEFKKTFILTGPRLLTGAQLADSASRALKIPVPFRGISRGQAKHLLSELENFSAELIRVLLDVFDCANDLRDAECHTLMPASDVPLLLPGRTKLREPEWFWAKYKDVLGIEP